MIDIERPTGATGHPLIALSDENIAFAADMDVNPAIHTNDFLFKFVDCLYGAEGGRERAVKEYLSLGRHGADLMRTVIADVEKVYEVAHWDWVPRRVLDFASSYGCTARHMRQVFPDSLCATCDIDIDAMSFTKDVLGVESYVCSPVPEQLKLPPQDVIVAHSFFSHMPQATWARWLKVLADALAPRGVLIFTTHGFALDKRGYPGLNVKENGFGFIPQSERDDLDTAEYGLTISYPRWVLPVLATMPELRLSKFHEGFWWGTHGTQDTYVCVKDPDRLPGGSSPALDHPETGSGTSPSVPRMSPAATEEYIASLYAIVLKRDPRPEEFARWVAAAANLPPEQVFFRFANSEEYRRRQGDFTPARLLPGHHHSPTADRSQLVENGPDMPRFGRSISFGEGGHSDELIGPGWSYQEENWRWMTGGFSVLALPLIARSDAADFILMLRVTPYTANGQIDRQSCTVVCGSETVAEVKLRASTWIGFRITARAAVSGKLAIVFVHPSAGSPQEFGISPDSRELAIAVHELVLLPVTEADELMGWRGRTGQFVSSDWRTKALIPDWKKIASSFQSVGQDCEFGLIQRHCGAEPLGLFRFCNIRLHALIQCLLSDFSELTNEDKLTIYPSATGAWPQHWPRVWAGEYFGTYESLDRTGVDAVAPQHVADDVDWRGGLLFHTNVRTDQNVDIDALRRKELGRLKLLVRLFREDLEDGEKIFVLLTKGVPLDEFEVLPVISLMRRYNPKAALLWVTVAEPDERHLVGQCEVIGNNLLKGYLDRVSAQIADSNTLSSECWKNILVSALQALDIPIPTHAQSLPAGQERLEVGSGLPKQMSGVETLLRRALVFGRSDGAVYSHDFELRDDGTIGGYDHPNERRWRAENGAIVLTRDDGTITCVLQRKEPTPLGEEVYSGEFCLPHPGPAVIHILKGALEE